MIPRKLLKCSTADCVLAKVNTRNIQYKSMADKAASVSHKDTTPDTGKKYKEGSMASKANLVKDFNNKNTK